MIDGPFGAANLVPYLERLENRLELMRLEAAINRDFDKLGHLTKTTAEYERRAAVLRMKLNLS